MIASSFQNRLPCTVQYSMSDRILYCTHCSKMTIYFTTVCTVQCVGVNQTRRMELNISGRASSLFSQIHVLNLIT